MMNGTFHSADGNDYRARFIGEPDEDTDAIHLEVTLPEGHPDKPEGGLMLLQAMAFNFTPDDD
jgi:hypothetical protein